MKKNRLDRIVPETCISSWIEMLRRHPYLSAFAVCLLLNPLYFGAEANVPSNTWMLAALLVLAGGAVLLIRAYRLKKTSLVGTILLSVLLAGFSCGTAMLHASSTKGIWLFAGGTLAFLGLYSLTWHAKQLRPQTTALLILCISFLLKFCYVFYTSVYTRQHDVGLFGADQGHAGYIEYLLYHHSLPNFDPRAYWQFYHPPLHHTISAVWIWLSENLFGVEHNCARESLQTLTLFYAMAIVITAYRILRQLRLKGMALYIPLVLVAFHPAFILFSGSINNDALSTALLMGAILCAMRWYKNPSWKETILLALCIGLGMMTKLSVGMAAIPIGVVMVVKGVQLLRARQWGILRKAGVFLGICAPLGLWYPIRNLVRFGVPLNYVQQLNPDNPQYLGERSIWSRMVDFSPEQFRSVFEQFLQRDETYNEFNPLTALLKNALFGEYIQEETFPLEFPAVSLCTVFFWLGVLLAGTAFAATIWVLLRRQGMEPIHKLLLGTLYLTLLVSFYKLSADYPFVCSMNSRYITPVIVVEAAFLGMALQQWQGCSRKPAKAAVVTASGLIMLFAVMSMVIYLGVCMG